MLRGHKLPLELLVLVTLDLSSMFTTHPMQIRVKVRVLGQAVENTITTGLSTAGIGTTTSMGQFRSGEGTYTGTLAVVKRQFDLEHRGRPISVRSLMQKMEPPLI